VFSQASLPNITRFTGRLCCNQKELNSKAGLTHEVIHKLTLSCRACKWNLFHRLSPLSDLSPSRVKAPIRSSPLTGRTQEGCIKREASYFQTSTRGSQRFYSKIFETFAPFVVRVLFKICAGCDEL